MAGGSATGVAGLPPTVRATLIARIAAAPEAAQRVLRVAAVAGRRVDHDLLAQVVDLSEAELTEGLRAAIDRQLLVQDGDGESAGFAFRHALVQEAAYDDLLPGERRSLHRAYAEALAGRDPARGGEPSGPLDRARPSLGGGPRGRPGGRRPRSAPATPPSRPTPSPPPSASSSSPSSSGTASRTPRRRSGSTGSTSSPARPAPPRWTASSIAPRSSCARRSRSRMRPPIRSAAALLRARLGRALWRDEGAEPSLATYADAIAMLPADQPTADRARVLAGMGQILMLVDRFGEAIAPVRGGGRDRPGRRRPAGRGPRAEHARARASRRSAAVAKGSPRSRPPLAIAAGDRQVRRRRPRPTST